MHWKKISVLVIGLVLVSGLSSVAQIVFLGQKGTISFYSKTPMEDISAVNKEVSSALNISTGEIAVLAEMKRFDFPNKLMQEHFNENYMESEKYPRASFKGVVQEKIDLTKTGKQPVTAKGKLNIHGVEKDYTLVGTYEALEGGLQIITAFDVMLVDHKIDVPKAVFLKIAEKISVKSQIQLQPKK